VVSGGFRTLSRPEVRDRSDSLCMLSTLLACPEPRRLVSLSRLPSVVLIAILIFSWLVSALTSSVLSPFAPPDERHHYSYVKYVAEHPTEFPPRYERMTTQGGDINHLMHPPLYYQLMAIPYWMSHLDQELTVVGRQTDSDGALSTRAMIAVLRTASLVLVAGYLVGLYLLLRYVVAVRLIPAWAAVLAGACLALVPGFTFIAAALNNDVLALTVTPFLLLFAIRFARDVRRRDLYSLVLFAAAAVLTKATLWVLVAFVAVVATARWLTASPDDRQDGTGRVRAGLGRIRPRSPGDWFVATGALLGVVAALVQVVVTWARYGSPQPRPPDVFGTEALQSTVWASAGSTSIEPLGVLEFSHWALTLMYRSLFGIFSHTERFYAQNPSRLMYVMMTITLIASIVAVVRLSRNRAFSDWLAAGLIGLWVVFLLVFLYRSRTTYHQLGTFGVHGRYTAGYIHALVLGTLGVFSRTVVTSRHRWWRVGAWAGFGVVTLVLVILFAHPFYYLSRTHELHARTNVASLVEGEAARLGMSPVDLVAVTPQRFVENGSDHRGRGFLPEPRFLMAWSNSTVVGPINLAHDLRCVEIWVYGEGDKAWGRNSTMEISVVASSAEVSELFADESIVSRRVDLPAHPEVVRVLLDVGDYEGDAALVAIRHTNVAVEGPPLVGWLGPSTRVVELFAAYSRPSSC